MTAFLKKIKFHNLLSKNLTNWPIWFVVFPFISMIVASMIVLGLSLLGKENSLFLKFSPILQFILFAFFTVLLVRIFQRKKVVKSDLGLDKDLNKNSIFIIILVFIITHLSFYLLGKIGNISSDPLAEFKSFGFGEGFISDLFIILSGTILAPICEEIIYRSVMLRSLHDSLARKFKKSSHLIFSLPVILSITITSLAFILPHVNNANFGVISLAYFISSAGFCLVYILTRSIIAAMVSHSLQSAVAFSTILISGHGEITISPIIYIIALTCPVIVYFLAKSLRHIFKSSF